MLHKQKSMIHNIIFILYIFSTFAKNYLTTHEQVFLSSNLRHSVLDERSERWGAGAKTY